MNNSKKLFVSSVIIALFYTSCALSATKTQIKQRLDTLKTQLSAIDSQVLTTSISQDDKNAQIKNNFERIKAILREIIEQLQETLSAQ